MVKVVDNFDAEYEVRLTLEQHVHDIITVVINCSKTLLNEIFGIISVRYKRRKFIHL